MSRGGGQKSSKCLRSCVWPQSKTNPKRRGRILSSERGSYNQKRAVLLLNLTSAQTFGTISFLSNFHIYKITCPILPKHVRHYAAACYCNFNKANISLILNIVNWIKTILFFYVKCFTYIHFIQYFNSYISSWSFHNYWQNNLSSCQSYSVIPDYIGFGKCKFCTALSWPEHIYFSRTFSDF